jgi:hypothetical protein
MSVESGAAAAVGSLTPGAAAAGAGGAAGAAAFAPPSSTTPGNSARKRRASVSSWGIAALAVAAEAPYPAEGGGSYHPHCTAGDVKLAAATVAAAKASGLGRCQVCMRTRRGQCGSLYAPLTCTNRAPLGLPYLDDVTQQVVVPPSWTSSVHKLAAGPRVSFVPELVAGGTAGAGGGTAEAAAQQAQGLVASLERQLQVR